jgi:PAS domain S-box-containing protein
MKGNHQNENVTGHKALRASEVTYRRLFEAAKDGILILDADTGRINDVNPFLFKLLGFSRSEMVGKTVGELSPFKDIESNKVMLERLQKSGYVRYEDLPLETRDGRKIAVEFVSNVYQAGDCNVIQCNVRDITVRKRTEEQLKASFKKIADLQSALDEHAIVAITDPQGRIIYVNDKFCSISQYSREELLGQDHRIVNSGYHPKEFIRDLWATITQGRVWHGEIKNKAKDGSFYWMDMTIVPSLNDQGKPRQYVAIRTDITERKRAEQTLRASEVSYRRLFEAAKDGILILDTDTGRIRDVNPFLLEMLGFSHSEMVGKSIWEISPFRDILSNKDKFVQLQQQGYVRYDNLPLETRDGRHVSVEFVSNVYQAGDCNVIQCNIRDITVRKQAEEQLKASFKEIGELNTNIRNFYHTLSHELKTPLTSAREFISIVIDGLAGPLNETQLEYLGVAKESCDQLCLYINDLLDVTRLETGKMRIEFQTLSLVGLVERVVEMLAPAAAGKGVSLACDCQPDLPAVPIDRQRILQVLTNLTTNAIKFTPAGGHIRLILSEAPADPECLQVDVRDTGRGIPEDQLDTIFNRRYQANYNAQSVDSQSGLGLGLYICQELVDLHGGRIWVESEIGKGSTFSFVIPKQAVTEGACVLIVDDDRDMREMLRLVLEEQHFKVATAGGGSEALQLMGKKAPDIVVLDLMMAGLDGPSTLKEIRLTWGLVPVLVYTGYPDGDLMRKAMESSPFTFLAKPCPLQQFVETVRRTCHTQETRFLKKNDKAGRAPVAQSARNHFTSDGPAPHPVLNS